MTREELWFQPGQLATRCTAMRAILRPTRLPQRTQLFRRSPYSTTSSVTARRMSLTGRSVGDAKDAKGPSGDLSINRSEAGATVDPAITELAKKIYATGTKTVLYITGGGATAFGWLFPVPGSSSSLLEAMVPYSQRSTTELLGRTPEKFVSVDTAVNLAKAAYRRASALAPFGVPLLGVSATCALATTQPKKGDHQCVIGVHSKGVSKVYSLTMEKGARSRLEEDVLASRVIVGACAEACGLTETAVRGLTADHLLAREEIVEETRDLGEDALDALLSGKIGCLEFCGEHVVVDAPRAGSVILPGSFNPLHDGHRELLKAAEEISGKDGCFELAVQNADKGFLEKEDVIRRVSQFTALGIPVMLTLAPLFTLKADIFKGCTFVVGYDTAVRLVNEKYYGGKEANMLVEFERLRSAGCDFLVAGRLDNGNYKVLDSVNVPPDLKDLFRGISEEQFRLDISSTEIRKQQGTE